MSATNFFHCCANCGSAEDVSAGTTRCPGCGAPITPDEMDINAFTDLQEDLRNAYRAAEKHTQRALLLRVLKWMGDGPTALQLNESGIEEWLPKSDYDTLFQRYADVCAELAIAKGPPGVDMVLVPREPTPEMIDALVHQKNLEGGDRWVCRNSSAVAIYKAAINAFNAKESSHE